MKIQSEALGTEIISKLLIKLATPAMVGMFVMALYNVVATIFVERAVGMIGVSAVSIAFPMQMIIMALAGAIGIGAASVISRMLGANKLDTANQIFGNALSLVFLISIIAAFAALKIITPILLLFGSTETILPYAQDYLGIILYGTVFFAFQFCMNNIIRSEGNAKTAMTTMLISAILNIILTPIFIFTFGLGIKGSALSAVLASAITCVYIIYYIASGKSSLSFNIRYLIPKWSLIKQILAIGSSAFVQQASASVMFVIANHMLVIYGGDLAVGVFGIIHRIIMFSMMPILGIVQGLLPIVGYNYGAKQFDRVNEGILLGFKSATVIAIFFFAIIMIFPKQLFLVFTSEHLALQMGIPALRIMFSLSITIGVSMITAGVFQSLGNAKVSLILSLSRQVLFLIPLLLTLPLMFDLTGIWLAFPLSDLLSFLLAIWFMKQYKEIFLGDLARTVLSRR